MKSVVRLTDRPDMTLDVYRGRKTTIQQQQHLYRALTFVGVCTRDVSRLLHGPSMLADRPICSIINLTF